MTIKVLFTVKAHEGQARKIREELRAQEEVLEAHTVRDGKFDGQGTFYFADGRKYVGQWQNSQFHGQGTFTAPSGTYVGEFKNGEFHGQGIMTLPDGRKIVGQWKNGALVGAQQ